MKKIYLPIVLMFASLIIFGQATQFEKIDYISKIRNEKLKSLNHPASKSNADYLKSKGSKVKLDYYINQWGPTEDHISKSEFKYNEKGQHDVELIYQKQPNGDLALTYKLENTYTATNKISLVQGYQVKNDNFEIDFKEEFKYDSKDNLIEHAGYLLDPQKNEWRGIWKNTMKYNNDNKLIEYVYYDVVIDKLLPTNKGEIKYNENNVDVTTIEYQYNPSNDKWEPMAKTETFFKAKKGDEDIDYELNYYFDEVANDFVLHGKDVYFYNAQNNLIRIETQEKQPNGSWLTIAKEEYNLNIDGYPDEVIYYDWDDAVNGLLNVNRIIYEYYQPLQEEFNAPFWIYNEMPGAAITVKKTENYDRITKNWLLNGLQKFFYSEDNSSFNILKSEKGALKIYPNPVVNDLSIIYDGNYRIEISDITGKILVKEDLNGNSVINLGNLSKGMYLLKFETNDFSKTVKFLKN